MFMSLLKIDEQNVIKNIKERKLHLKINKKSF